jgi:hypothetical protein
MIIKELRHPWTFNTMQYCILHFPRCLDQKPNSRAYNFVAVSVHNLESSQVFLLSPLQCTVTELPRNCKRLREFKEIEIS